MFKYLVITLLILVALTAVAKKILRLDNRALLALNTLLFSLAALYPYLAQRLPPATLAALYALIGAAACLVFYFALRYPSKVYQYPMALSKLEKYQQRPWTERLFSKKEVPGPGDPPDVFIPARGQQGYIAGVEDYAPEENSYNAEVQGYATGVQEDIPEEAINKQDTPEKDMLEKNASGLDFLAVLRYKMQRLPGPGETSQETGLKKTGPRGELLPAGDPGKPGDTVESFLAAGFSARAQGDYARALTLFLKALGLGPAPNAALSLALEISSIYMAMGQYTQARMILSATAARGLPGDAPLLQGLRERLAYIECLTDLLAQAKLTNIPYFQAPEAIIRQAQKNTQQQN